MAALSSERRDIRIWLKRWVLTVLGCVSIAVSLSPWATPRRGKPAPPRPTLHGAAMEVRQTARSILRCTRSIVPM